jgi:hypothetical protein
MMLSHAADELVELEETEKEVATYMLPPRENVNRFICVALDESPEAQYALTWTLDHIISASTKKDLVILLS